MRGKVLFLGGLALGFVLGTRAGREKYEEIVSTARKIKDHPTVQEASGVVQEQANRLLNEGKDRLGHTRLGEKLLHAVDGDTSHPSQGRSPDPALAAAGAGASRTTNGGTTARH